MCSVSCIIHQHSSGLASATPASCPLYLLHRPLAIPYTTSHCHDIYDICLFFLPSFILFFPLISFLLFLPPASIPFLSVPFPFSLPLRSISLPFSISDWHSTFLRSHRPFRLSLWLILRATRPFARRAMRPVTEQCHTT